MKTGPKVALGEICTPAGRDTAPKPGEIYRQLGVRLWGEGAYEREQIDGADTKRGGHMLATDADALQIEHVAQHAGASKRMLQVQFIDAPHQPPIATLAALRIATSKVARRESSYATS